MDERKKVGVVVDAGHGGYLFPNIKNWGIANGLSRYFVKSIFFDGIIWVWGGIQWKSF